MVAARELGLKLQTVKSQRDEAQRLRGQVEGGERKIGGIRSQVEAMNAAVAVRARQDGRVAAVAFFWGGRRCAVLRCSPAAAHELPPKPLPPCS